MLTDVASFLDLNLQLGIGTTRATRSVIKIISAYLDYLL